MINNRAYFISEYFLEPQYFISELFYYFISEDFNTGHFRTIYMDYIWVHYNYVQENRTCMESFYTHLNEELYSAHPSIFVFIDANSNVCENEKSWALKVLRKTEKELSVIGTVSEIF
jgi:hypothetical protein